MLNTIDCTVYFNPCMSCYMYPILVKQNVNKYIYNTFVNNNNVPTSQQKWLLLYKNVNINWKVVYSYVFKCTRDSYIQWLQTRISHRILPTNNLLYKMKLVDSKLCSFCECCEETLVHLFWDCNKIQPVLKHIIETVNTVDSNIVINSLCVLLGSGNNNFKLDILFLEYKKIVFLCKRKKVVPTISLFNNSLKLAWEIYDNTKLSDKDRCNWAFVRLFLS